VSRASKRAGSRFEKWVADKFVGEGWASARLRSFLVVGEPDLYATTNGILLDIQAKERQNLNVHRILTLLQAAQVEIAQRQGIDTPVAIPVVIHKRVEKKGKTGRRTQVGDVQITLTLDDFLRIVEMGKRVQ
jgi:Holliday junction resolvase